MVLALRNRRCFGFFVFVGGVAILYAPRRRAGVYPPPTLPFFCHNTRCTPYFSCSSLTKPLVTNAMSLYGRLRLDFRRASEYNWSQGRSEQLALTPKRKAGRTTPMPAFTAAIAKLKREGWRHVCTIMAGVEQQQTGRYGMLFTRDGEEFFLNRDTVGKVG